MLENLTRGVLHVSGEGGLQYVEPSLGERLKLLWLFRNFRVLSQHVLSDNERRFIQTLCSNGRLRRYSTVLDREMAAVVGTLVTSELSMRPAHQERRRAPRLAMPFELRYGSPAKMTDGEGCDVSETGIGFEGPKSFPPGTEISVHFRLHSGMQEPWIRARAVVRNLHGRRMGVEFSIIHPRDRAELRRLTAQAVTASETEVDVTVGS